MKCLHPFWRVVMKETLHIWKLFVLHGDETPIKNRLLCRQGLIYAFLYSQNERSPHKNLNSDLYLCASQNQAFNIIFALLFLKISKRKNNNNWTFFFFHTCTFWIDVSQHEKKKEKKYTIQLHKSFMRMEASGRCKNQQGIYLD